MSRFELLIGATAYSLQNHRNQDRGRTSNPHNYEHAAMRLVVVRPGLCSDVRDLSNLNLGSGRATADAQAECVKSHAALTASHPKKKTEIVFEQYTLVARAAAADALGSAAAADPCIFAAAPPGEWRGGVRAAAGQP